MAAQKGEEVVLKIGNADVPEIFTPIGGLRSTGFSFNSLPAEASHLASGGWQELMNYAGLRSFRIQAGGMFTDTATEALIRSMAMSNTLRNFQITFGNGDLLQGSFKITQYHRHGAHRGEESYELTLESSGAVTYTAA